jgi:DNA-binding PadR family transcriptional regulator
MHGYELIQALADRFGGTYVQSAGTIYPRLAKLEEEGLVTKTADGRKTVYAITDAGRAELAARESDLDGIESELTDSVRRLADEVRSSVDGAMRSLRADLAAAAREARAEAGPTRVEHVDERRLQSRRRLHEAESAINQFRFEVRSELRRLAADDRLDASIVDLVTSGLRTLRRDVTSAARKDS